MTLDWEYINELDFDLDLDFFLGHCTFIKSVFINEQNSLSGKFKDALSKVTENQKERFYNHFETEQYYIGDLFPSIHWSAMFVAGFNLFEKTINDICKIVHAISKSNKGLKDESGQGIERAKVYLSKTHNITIPFSKKQWEKIASFAKFRNVLSHTAGELDLSQKKHLSVLKIAEKEPSVRIERHNTVFETADIIVDEEFVFNSIRIYREFIGILVSEIKIK